MATVYEILNILPTDTFSDIRKAYLKKAKEWHPDKHPEDRANAEIKFKEIAAAYERVDSQVKATSYLTWYNQQPVKPDVSIDPHSFEPSFSSHFSQSAEPSSSHATHEEPTDAVRLFNDGKEVLFIPIPITKVLYWEEYGKEWTPAAFDFIASLLQENFSKYDEQVGVTPQEAIDIINQHSQHEQFMIVEARVRLADILPDKLSEKEYFPGRLNVHSTPYFWVQKNTQFSADDIISFKPFTYNDFQNTIRNSKWPEHVKKITQWPGIECHEGKPFLYVGGQVRNSSRLAIGMSPSLNTEVTALVPASKVPDSAPAPMPSSSTSQPSVGAVGFFSPEQSDLHQIKVLVRQFKETNMLAKISPTISSVLSATSVQQVGQIAHREKNAFFLYRTEELKSIIATLAKLQNPSNKVSDVISELQSLVAPSNALVLR
jgi:hypothetical protein